MNPAGLFVDGVRRRHDFDGERRREGLDAALRLKQWELRRRNQSHVGSADGVFTQTEQLLGYDFARVLLSVQMVHQSLNQPVANAVVQIGSGRYLNQFSL